MLWCVLFSFGSYLFIQTRFEHRLREQLQIDPGTGNRVLQIVARLDSDEFTLMLPATQWPASGISARR